MVFWKINFKKFHNRIGRNIFLNVANGIDILSVKIMLENL